MTRTPAPSTVLVVLTAAVTLAYLDRYIFAVLVEPIKAELALSDTAIGVLAGFAFTTFYALCGLPIARLADRGLRRPIICVSILIWSAMTGLTGVVQNFWQMAFARFGVSVGEAGIVPVSHSILADTFSAAKRTSALGIFASGASIGLLLAFAVGGWVGPIIGWRWTFLVMAIPGVILSLAVATIVPPQPPVINAQPPLLKLLPKMLTDSRYLHVPFLMSAHTVLVHGQVQWLPAFFERSYEVSGAQLGITLGVTQGLASIGGVVLGGIVGDRIRQKDLCRPLRLARASIVLAIVPMLFLYLGSYDVWTAYALSAAASFLLAMPSGPIAAHVQFIAQPSQRAAAIAVVIVISYLIGGGAGPVLIGGMSDLLLPSERQESLRYALLTVMPAMTLWAIFHASRLIRAESRALRMGGHEDQKLNSDLSVKGAALHNLRDMGGCSTTDGRRVKRGVLFRSGVMGELREADYEKLRELRIIAVYDLRANRERKARDSEWTNPGISYHCRNYESSSGDLGKIDWSSPPKIDEITKLIHQVYRELPFEQAAAYRELFQLLIKGKVPLLFSCSAGKDRTGIGAALILFAIGVEPEAIDRDYSLTNLAMENFETLLLADPRYKVLTTLPHRHYLPLLRADPTYLSIAFEEIVRKYGSMAAYLETMLGIGPSEIATLRDLLLE